MTSLLLEPPLLEPPLLPFVGHALVGLTPCSFRPLASFVKLRQEACHLGPGACEAFMNDVPQSAKRYSFTSCDGAKGWASSLSSCDELSSADVASSRFRFMEPRRLIKGDGYRSVHISGVHMEVMVREKISSSEYLDYLTSTLHLEMGPTLSMFYGLN